MRIVKGRKLIAGQSVQVYYNLHQGGYSIRDKKTGLVVGYAQNVLLRQCVFKVSEKGRQKVIEQKKKFVHAFIEGVFLDADLEHPSELGAKVYYNPYLTEKFTVLKTGQAVNAAEKVFCIDKVSYV